MKRFLLSAGLVIAIGMALVIMVVWEIVIEWTTAPLFAKHHGLYYIGLVAWGMGLGTIVLLLYVLAGLLGG